MATVSQTIMQIGEQFGIIHARQMQDTAQHIFHFRHRVAKPLDHQIGPRLGCSYAGVQQRGQPLFPIRRRTIGQGERRHRAKMLSHPMKRAAAFFVDEGGGRIRKRPGWEILGDGQT